MSAAMLSLSRGDEEADEDETEEVESVEDPEDFTFLFFTNGEDDAEEHLEFVFVQKLPRSSPSDVMRRAV